MCLTNIPTQGIFKRLWVIYFQNMCTVTCDFSRRNKRIALLSKRFGITVLVYSNLKYPSRSSVV